jgi:ribosomal protein S18 acetylase RimI-like enzyme
VAEDVQIRAGTAADVAAMYALDQRCFDVTFQFDLRSMREYACARNAIVRVAEAPGETGRLAGFVILEVRPRRGELSAYVVTLDVEAGFRRQGLARRMLAEAEEAAGAAGAGWVWLHVFAGNAGAVLFYEAAGYDFVERSAGLYGAGLDALVYTKRLNA